MSSLSVEQIDALLKGQGPSKKDGRVSPFAPIIHVGPLRYSSDVFQTCAHRGCGAQCLITVGGVPLCSTHALTELNRLLMKTEGYDWVITECTCKAGKYSDQNMHTDDCAVYAKLKEEQSDAESSSIG